jgi:hypothetical protein
MRLAAARSLRSRASSSVVHGLLLFFGMGLRRSNVGFDVNLAKACQFLWRPLYDVSFGVTSCQRNLLNPPLLLLELLN